MTTKDFRIMRLHEILVERDEQTAELAASKLGTTINTHLGNGMWGDAYLTNDNTVIKLTTHEDEAEIAVRLKGEDITNVVRIYEVIPLKNCWAIHQEFLNTSGIEDIWNEAQHDLQDNGLYFGDDEDDIKTEISDESRKFISDIGWAIENLVRYGVQALDLSPDNIGKRGNDYVVFDVMNNWIG